MSHAAALERAIAFAVTKHAGQVDKAGSPYILHPLRVMGQMEDDVCRIAAVLHDVVEDCEDVSMADIEALDLPAEAVEVVALMTHPADEPYEDYIGRLAPHPLARQVKLADLDDNMNVRRLTQVTGKEQKRLARYLKAYRHLTAASLPPAGHS
ncbi:MAG: GTP pyrophosphokinase [Alphaproteobacteria bacterium]